MPRHPVVRIKSLPQLIISSVACNRISSSIRILDPDIVPVSIEFPVNPGIGILQRYRFIIFIKPGFAQHEISVQMRFLNAMISICTLYLFTRRPIIPLCCHPTIFIIFPLNDCDILVVQYGSSIKQVFDPNNLVLFIEALLDFIISGIASHRRSVHPKIPHPHIILLRIKLPLNPGIGILQRCSLSCFIKPGFAQHMTVIQIGFLNPMISILARNRFVLNSPIGRRQDQTVLVILSCQLMISRSASYGISFHIPVSLFSQISMFIIFAPDLSVSRCDHNRILFRIEIALFSNLPLLIGRLTDHRISRGNHHQLVVQPMIFHHRSSPDIFLVLIFPVLR